MIRARPTNAQLRRQRMLAARAKASHTPDEWLALLAACSNRCVRCGSPFTDVSPMARPQRDHIIPIYQGGSDGIENIQPLCCHCNTSKGPDATDLRPLTVQALFKKGSH